MNRELFNALSPAEKQAVIDEQRARIEKLDAPMEGPSWDPMDIMTMPRSVPQIAAMAGKQLAKDQIGNITLKHQKPQLTPRQQTGLFDAIAKEQQASTKPKGLTQMDLARITAMKNRVYDKR